jgi:hypothetical protein
MAPMSAEYEKTLWTAARAFLRAAIPDAPPDDCAEAFSALAAAALARAEALGKSPPPGCAYRADTVAAADAIFALVRETSLGRDAIFRAYVEAIIGAETELISRLPYAPGWQS